MLKKEKCLIVAVEEESRRRRSVSLSRRRICRTYSVQSLSRRMERYEINALLPPRKAWLPVEKN